MIVEQYLDAIFGHVWDGLRACLRADVVRVGPFRDEYSGRDAYVAFLSQLMPTLSDYSMEVSRVTYAGDRAFAELAENVGGVRTEEALVFELVDGLIGRVDIYIKTSVPG